MATNGEEVKPQNLEAAWEIARRTFLQRTNVKLSPEAQHSLDSVLSSFDAKYNPEPSKVEAVQTKNRIKDNVIKVCTVVNVLGSVAAQGASMVFGPAGTCFNAISILLDAPGKIYKVYDGLADLFEEVAHFLVRFDILKRIDAEGLLDQVLINNSSDLLIKLVDICGLMVVLIRKSAWTKFKTGLKAALINDDSGVQAALESFRLLADRQGSIIQDFNLYHAARTDASMGRLEPKMELVWEDINVRRNKESSKERLRSLAAKLNVPLEDLDNLTTVPQNKLHDIARKLFSGTQEWLNSLVPYAEWKKSQPGMNRLLHISAEDQGGKSCFLASVFSDALGADTDLLICHYACGETPSSSAENEDPIGTEPSLALKAMALQLAQVNVEYATALENALTDSPMSDDEKLNDIWDILFSIKIKSRSTAKVLLLIDDVGDLPIEICEEFMSMMYEKCDQMAANKSLDIWVMTAADTRILGQMSSRSFIQVDVHDHSAPLIDKHIVRTIETHAVLRQSHPGIMRLRSEIRNRLPRLARGDFGFVNKRIDRLVRNVQSGQDSLDELLDQMTRDPAAEHGSLVRQSLRNLEETLNVREIEHLNILLQWTMYGGRRLTLEQLEQALLLDAENDQLLPLEGKIRHRYNELFKIEDSRLILKEDVQTYLRTSSTNAQISNTQPTKISLTVQIDNASSKQVRQFLWRLNDAVSTGDLRFDFSNLQQDTGRPMISLSAADALSTITSQCLQLLTDDEGRQKYGSLITYALQQLPHLLGELRKIAEAGQLSPSNKRIVVQRLINLLRDTESWVKHFQAHDDRAIWFAWILPLKILDDLQFWLTESEALKMIEPIDRRWAKSLMSIGKASGSFWQPFTVEVARLWLRVRNVSTALCWHWIDFYLDMENGTQTGQKSGGPEYWHPRIRAAASWSQEALGLQTLDALYFERFGYAFLDGINNGMTTESRKRWAKAAIEEFSQAQTYAAYHWRVDRGIAMAYHYIGDHELASENMLKAITKLESGVDAVNREEKEELSEELKRLASWRASAGDYKHASRLYDQVLELNPVDYGCHWRRFRCFCVAREEHKARAALTDLANRKARNSDATQLAESLHRLVTGTLDISTVGDDLTDSLLSVVKDAEIRSKVLGAISDNLTYAQRQRQPFDQARMLLLEGLILAQSANRSEELKMAQQAWRKCIVLCEGHSNVSKWLSVLRLALRHEGAHHFDQLLEANANSRKAADTHSHLYYLRRIAKATIRAFGRPYYGPATYLTAYYWLNNRQNMARKILHADIQRAFEILSDDDPENDLFGYNILVHTLNHSGDPVNALTAFSLLAPPAPSKTTTDKPPAKTPTASISHYCDGLCGTKWSRPDDMWICKYCPNTDFCTTCKEKLQQGKLERYWCSPKHDWLHIPPLSEQFADEIPPGYVRMGGQMQGDKRVGGEVVEMKVWLDKLQEDWNASVVGLAEFRIGGDDDMN